MKKHCVSTLVLACSLVFCALPAYGYDLETVYETRAKNVTKLEGKNIAIVYMFPGSSFERDRVSINANKFNYREHMAVRDGDILNGTSSRSAIDLDVDGDLVQIPDGTTVKVSATKNKKKFVLEVQQDKYDKTKRYMFHHKTAGSQRIVALIAYISGIKHAELKNTVNTLRASNSKYKDNDELAKHIINIKAAKEGVTTLLGGLTGTLTLPVDIAKSFTAWVVHAQLAYSIACAYGNPPTKEEFEDQLYVLLAGDKIVKSAFKEVGGKFKDAAKEKIITKAVTSALTSDAAKKKLVAILGKKLAAKLTKKFITNALEHVSAATAVLAAFAEYADMKKFGERAQEYYRP